MATVSEERDELERMLRKVRRSGVALPNDVSAWWKAEQQQIAQEDAAKEARRQQRISDLTARIAELQSQLGALT